MNSERVARGVYTGARGQQCSPSQARAKMMGASAEIIYEVTCSMCEQSWNRAKSIHALHCTIVVLATSLQLAAVTREVRTIYPRHTSHLDLVISFHHLLYPSQR